MDQATLNQAESSGEASLLPEIMQLLKNKDKDFLNKTRDVLLKNPADMEKESTSSLQDLEGVWSNQSEQESSIRWQDSVKSTRKKAEKKLPKTREAPGKSRPETWDSTSSIIPPTPGMNAALGLFARIQSKKQVPSAPATSKLQCRPKEGPLSDENQQSISSQPDDEQPVPPTGETQESNSSKSTLDEPLPSTSTYVPPKQTAGRKRKNEKAPEQNIEIKKRKITRSAPVAVKELFACDLCGEMRDRLDRHYEAAHKMSKNAAKARSKLQKAATGKGHKVYTCSECGKVVRFLAEHLANIHGIKRHTEESSTIRKQAKRVSLYEQFELVKPTTDMETPRKRKIKNRAIIADFVQWLQTMRGKKKGQRSACQHGAQAYRMWKALSEEDVDDDRKDLDLKGITSNSIFEYVETQRPVTNPGTLRSYLGSFKYFLEYLKKMEREELSDDLLRNLIEEVNNYSCNLRQAVSERKAEYALQEHENLLPASVIDEFLNSYYLQTIETTINRQETFDSITNYCKVRDALMAMLVCTNAQRTSAVRDVRPNNVLKAKVEGQMRVFGVAHHKTSASRGVANFSLEQRFFSLMQQFAVQTIEQKDGTRNETSPMFLTFEGNEMAASNATQSIKRALEKAGVLKNYTRNVTATMIRKLVTTLVREDEPGLAEPLSQQLSHSSRTAEGTYQLKQSQKSSAKVVQAIQKSISTAAMAEKNQELQVMSEESVRESVRDQSSQFAVANDPNYSPEVMSEESVRESVRDQSSQFAVANDPEESSFNLPSKAEFIKRLHDFSEQEPIGKLIDRGSALWKERRTNKWVCFMEGSRYKIVADFEALVKKEYGIEFSTLVSYSLVIIT